jgi:molybdopterin/thiamine biosynthesis adenylyltransferase
MSGPSGIPLAGLELPPWYLIGAGAVGQALVAAIIAARVRAHLTVIDGDAIDDTNLNRYILAVLSNLGDSKADLAAGYLRAAGHSVYSYGSSWPKYAFSVPHIGQRADLQAYEAEYKYARVLSCVDKNTARRAIQQFWPQLLLGASTDGMGLQVTHYDMNGPYECLKCSNPAEVNLRTLEDAEADLRSRSAEEVRAAAHAVGADPDLVARYLADPKCGELGQQELAKFLAASDERAFSVGFVSVAAGVLLGAQLFKGELVGWDKAFPPDRGATLRLSFLNPGPHWSKHLRRKQECDCSSVGRQEYGALWV